MTFSWSAFSGSASGKDEMISVMDRNPFAQFKTMFYEFLTNWLNFNVALRWLLKLSQKGDRQRENLVW